MTALSEMSEQVTGFNWLRVRPIARRHAYMRVILDGGDIPWGTIGLGSLGAVVLTALARGFLLRMLRLFGAHGFISRYS